jgi:hypothetical protein
MEPPKLCIDRLSAPDQATGFPPGRPIRSPKVEEESSMDRSAQYSCFLDEAVSFAEMNALFAGTKETPTMPAAAQEKGK